MIQFLRFSVSILLKSVLYRILDFGFWILFKSSPMISNRKFYDAVPPIFSLYFAKIGIIYSKKQL